MTKLEKMKMVKAVLGGGKKIADVAKNHGVSTTTVRRYMDQYTEGNLKLDMVEELEHLRLHVHLANTDSKDILQDRLELMNTNLELIIGELQ